MQKHFLVKATIEEKQLNSLKTFLNNVHLIRFIIINSYNKFLNRIMPLYTILGACNKVMKGRTLSSKILWPSGEGPVNGKVDRVAMP